MSPALGSGDRRDRARCCCLAERFQALLQTGSHAALKFVVGVAEVIAQRLASANAKLVELADKVEAAESKPATERDQFIQLQCQLQALSF